MFSHTLIVECLNFVFRIPVLGWSPHFLFFIFNVEKKRIFKNRGLSTFSPAQKYSTFINPTLNKRDWFNPKTNQKFMKKVSLMLRVIRKNGTNYFFDADERLNIIVVFLVTPQSWLHHCTHRPPIVIMRLKKTWIPQKPINITKPSFFIAFYVRVGETPFI